MLPRLNGWTKSRLAMVKSWEMQLSSCISNIYLQIARLTFVGWYVFIRTVNEQPNVGWQRLSFQEWLYRKAEQNAHREILAFSMMILGMNLLMGGLNMTVITAGGSNLFFYVTQQSLSQSAILGLALTIMGFLIISAGFVPVVHYDRQRPWHLSEVEKSTRSKNRKVTVRTPDELLKGLADESSEN
jgi:hypothetical protein